MRFPVTIRHRASKAKIYAPAGKFAYYRVAYATAGKRRMQTFANYSDAKAAAERIVRELANGSQAAALNASQAAVDAAHQTALPQLLQDARTKAQALATATGLKLGGITGVTEANYGAVGGISIPYAVITGTISSFSSSGTTASTQYTFYATVRFAVQ